MGETMSERRCGVCGKPLKENQKAYCSRPCANRANNAKYTKKTECICKGCGMTFIPKEANRSTYCSRECYFASIKAEPKLDRNYICKQCGKAFEGKGSEAYCSDDCRRARERRRYRETFVSVEETNPVVQHECAQCGRIFETRKNSDGRVFCSERCAHANGKQKRKASKRNSGSVFVSFAAIIRRDKGKCQLCGKPVALKQKAPHPKSPTLDHILPVSKGGKHHPDNVRLAHFECNSRRRNTGEAQLRLALRSEEHT